MNISFSSREVIQLFQKKSIGNPPDCLQRLQNFFGSPRIALVNKEVYNCYTWLYGLSIVPGVAASAGK